MSIFGFWSKPPSPARLPKGAAAPESSKRSNSGDDGAFLLKLVAMLQAQSDRADNTPLELNATAIEYLSSFVNRSRLHDQPPLPLEVQRGVRQLERLLLQVRHLRITLSRSKRRVDVSPFAALQVLEVNGVPVSSLEGHTALRMQLKSLRFEGATLESVAALLAPGFVAEEKREVVQPVQEGRLQQRRAASNSNGLQRPRSSGALRNGGDGDGSEDQQWLTARWGQLTTLVLNNCGLGEGTGLGLNDDTLRLAWQAKVIMLRSNGLRSIETAFSHCSQLESLDLSRNLLSDLPPLHLTLGNVTVLCLSKNEISHTSGLERLFCLVELDLRDNCLRDLREVHRLGSLPNLESLWLRGNPLESSLEDYKGAYRRRVFGVFTEYGERGGTVDYPTLDGLRMSDLERSHLLKEVFVKATGSLASTSNAQAARSISATMSTTAAVGSLAANFTAEDWAIATSSNAPMPTTELLGAVPENGEAHPPAPRLTRVAVIEDMSEQRLEERRQLEMEALDQGVDSTNGAGGKTMSTMYYVTKYEPPPKPDPPPPLPEDTDVGEDGIDNAEPEETLADLILKTPHEIYRSVAKCRKCGEYLPTQIDQIQEHLEQCKGDLHLQGLSSNSDDVMGEEKQESEQEVKTEEEAPDRPTDEDVSARAWVDRLTKLALDLGSAECGLVLDRRFEKRILRRAVVGRDMVNWLLAHCPAVCRDEEQAVVIGQTLMDRHFLVPLFHDDSFRFSDLIYRFQWDHKELSGQNRHRPRLGSSAAHLSSLDTESAIPRPTAADFGQFDPQVLLELVDRMRLAVNVKTRAPYRSVSTSSGLFRQCFKGSDAISWFLESSEAVDEFEALELGGALLCSGIIFLVTTRPDPIDSMPPPRSHLLHSFQNSASAFYRFSSAWVKRQRHTGTAYRSSLLSFHQESNNRDDTTTTSEPLPLVAPCSEKTNRGDQLLLSGGLAYFRSAAMYELKYAVGDSEDFDAVVHLEQLLDATASKEGDQEASSVEACEEVLTPILIAALAERLRVAPNMVQDRHLDSGGVTLSSAWLLGSSISDGKDWRRKAEDDEAPAYPSTFLGSEAVGWMVSSLGLFDNEDALVLGDLMLHLGLVFEVEPINPEATPSIWSTSPSNLEYRGFQNRRSVRYRFAKDDVLVREAAVKDYMQFQSAQASLHPPPIDQSPSESRSNTEDSRQRLSEIKEGQSEGVEANEDISTKNEVFLSLPNALSGLPLRRESGTIQEDVNNDSSNSTSPDRAETEVVKVPMPAGASEGDIVEVRLGGGLRTARVTISAGTQPGDLLSVHVPRPPPPPKRSSIKTSSLTGAASSLSSSASLTIDSLVSAASSSSAYLNPFVSPASPTSPDEKDALYVGPTEVLEYVGDAETADLLVGDNFVLYLRLQIFAPRQSSTARLAISSSKGSSARPTITKGSSNSNRTLLRLPTRCADEELQSGTLLSCLPWKTPQPAGMAHLFKLAPRLSEEGMEEKSSSDVAESLVWLVFTDRHVYFIDDACVSESRRLNLRFRDAPRPVVLRRYPLHCLQLLKIGFSFQSLMFGFAGAEKDADGLQAAPNASSDSASRRRSGSNDHSSSRSGGGGFGSTGGGFVRGSLHVGRNGAVAEGGAPRVFVFDGSSGAVSLLSDAPSSSLSPPALFDNSMSSNEVSVPSTSHVVQAGGFVFLTRDKTVTSALLTEVSELATLSRAKQKPPVMPEQVPVTNNDDEVLEAFSTLGVHHDEASAYFYQLCHQRWKSRPHLLSPRTMVITATSVFLCFEDHGGLGRGAPRLHVMDQALLGEVAKVRPEDSPNEVTILVRRPLKFKRWRLVLSSRANADRLITEVRRRIGAEDHDSDDDDMVSLSRGSMFNDVSTRGSMLSDSFRASIPKTPNLFGRSKS